MGPSARVVFLAALATALPAPAGPRDGIEPGPAWGPGPGGGAALFDGIDDALDCGRSATLDTPGGLTVAFRVRLEAHRPGTPIVSKPYAFDVIQGPADRPGSLELRAWPQGRACPTPEGAAARVVVPLRAWHHVALAYDYRGGRLRAWLDGRAVAEGSLAGGCPERSGFRLASGRYPLTLGAAPDAPGFCGALADVTLHSRVLRDAEVEALAGGSVPDQRLAARWRFDVPAGDVVPDASGHGNLCRRRVPPDLSALPLLGGPVSAPLLGASSGLTAWLASANRRVYRGDRLDRALPPPDVVVSLAVGEAEAFQVVLRPDRGLSDVRVAVSDLADGGHVLPSSACSVQRVAFVPVDAPSSWTQPYALPPGDNQLSEQRGPAGWHPDPLVAGSFDAPAREATPLWITVRAPSDQPPGVYRGHLTVSSAGARPLALPVAVRVWGFTLPRRLRRTAVAPFDLRYGEGLDAQAMIRDFAAHHVTPALLPPPEVRFEGTVAVLTDTRAFDLAAELALDRLGLDGIYFPLTGPYFLPRARDCAKRSWRGFRICLEPGVLAPDFEAALSGYLRQMGAHLAARGWLSRVRFSAMDEPATDADLALVRRAAELARRAAPGLTVAETHAPTPGLVGAVDTWVLGLLQPRAMAEARARGERLEWYPNLLPLVDRPATNTRVLGWALQRYALDGLFVWATQVAWRGLDREAAWRRPARASRDGHLQWGSGTFFYPDPDWRPLPSVRWELLRDTLEDAEMLAMLDDLCRALRPPGPPAPPRSPDERARVDEACAWLADAPARLVPAFEADDEQLRWRRLRWETDPQEFDHARDALGGYLEELSAPANDLRARGPRPPDPAAPAR